MEILINGKIDKMHVQLIRYGEHFLLCEIIGNEKID